MAEIHVEKKNKPVWPWILGILLLIGVAWLVVELVDTDPKETAYNEEVIITDQDRLSEEGVIDEQIGVSTDGSQQSQDQQAKDSQAMAGGQQDTADMNDFVAYVNDTKIKEQLGKDHQVTGEALMKLSNSLENISEDSFTESIDQIRQNAQTIQEDPESLQHADMVKQAFAQAADVLSQIQEQQFSDVPEAATKTENVQNASAKLKEQEQLLNQKEEVNTFFEEAASAVEVMENESSI